MVSLEIRSQLAKTGACQGANCLNSRWVYTALCSDKCLLCFSEKSDLLKQSCLPLFSFTFPPIPSSHPRPQTTELGRLKITSLVNSKALPPPLELFSFPPREGSYSGKGATQGRELPREGSYPGKGATVLSLWGREATLRRERRYNFHNTLVISGAGGGRLPWRAV